MFNTRFVCQDEQALASLAKDFSQHLEEGDVCLLYGEVGAGKTFFTSHLVEHLGGDSRLVGSPSFTLVNIYPLGSREIYHVDLYRLDGIAQEDDISQEDWMFPGKGFSFIEWAERLDHWTPDKGFRLHFAHLEEGRSLLIERI